MSFYLAISCTLGIQLASEQGKIERQIRSVEEEVQKQDECIKALQKQFKDAENLLVKQALI